MEDLDKRWPEGWITHWCPTYNEVATHSVKFHRDQTMNLGEITRGYLPNWPDVQRCFEEIENDRTRLWKN